MLIGFLGDVHGRVFHALAALATCQAETGRPFDLLVQVGDIGAFPDQERMEAMDPTTRVHLELAPEEADFRRLLAAGGERAANLRRLRARMPGAVHFVRGNHEDFDWLDGLPLDEASGTAPVDDFDAFRYVPDGTVLEAGGVKLVFLGGAEEDERPRRHRSGGLRLGDGTRVRLHRRAGDAPGSVRHYHRVPRRRAGLADDDRADRIAAAACSRRGARPLAGGGAHVRAHDLPRAGRARAVTDRWLADFDARAFDFDAWCEGALPAP